ncbi:DNA polymerase epsilon subunit 4-like [Lolium rigidum]|uniref:DNA polymerase epsilon subunit 4-like n=1 Tax=Lolium rigidum TaxID=89674 RepID=UPI001F5DA928|nr:DNA polymerase epsilon subunit 4-like [Lolium rigidum]
MATAAADEHAEAMEQVREEERAAEAVEAMEQVEDEERAEVDAEAPAEEGAPASDEAHIEAMEQVEEEAEEEVQADAEEAAEAEVLSTVFPLGRVKKIMRLDRDIKKVTAEASLLIAAATELFLGSLAAGAHTAATQRGRRGLRAADVRAAARAHRPTADFLLDCLSTAEEAPRAARSGSDAAAPAAAPKPLPRGTRRIDGFFQKVT